MAGEVDLAVGDRTHAAGLEILATRAGEAWARSCCEDLTREGRGVVGGWPGTMSEARRRVFAAIVQRSEAPPPSSLELDGLARTAYLAARTSWLALADRETPLEEP